MYDILQLNDMLVPELLDIAEQLKIPNAKKLSKQDLVYKILDSQAVIASEKKPGAIDDKPKRKRIIKTSTGISTEEAIVEESNTENKMAKSTRPTVSKTTPRKEERPVIKKGKKKEEEEQIETVAETEQQETEVEENDGNDDNGNNINNGSPERQIPQLTAEQENSNAIDASGQQKVYPQRRDQAFNIEFDGVIMAEG